MKTPMHQFLDKLLDDSDPTGQAVVALKFKLEPQIAKGAMRRAENIDGMFELLTIAQEGGQGQPFPLHQFFEPSEVSRVMVIGSPKDLPAIVAPPSSSGIIIPS